MPKYIIERNIPNAGHLSARELQSISQKSCAILTNEATVKEHAEKGGFPANSISQIRTSIDPTTAEA